MPALWSPSCKRKWTGGKRGITWGRLEKACLSLRSCQARAWPTIHWLKGMAGAAASTFLSPYQESGSRKHPSSPGRGWKQECIPGSKSQHCAHRAISRFSHSSVERKTAATEAASHAAVDLKKEDSYISERIAVYTSLISCPSGHIYIPRNCKVRGLVTKSDRTGDKKYPPATET